VAQGVPPRRSTRMPAGSRRGPSDEQRRHARPERPNPPPTAPSRYPDAFDDQGDEDLPPWAGPGIYPTGPGGKQRRPLRADEYEGRADPGPEEGSGRPYGDPAGDLPRSRRSRRAAAVRARKSRRRLIVAGAVVVVGALAVLAIFGKLPFQGTSAPPQNSGLVTTFQPGEFRSVPNACDAVGAATLSQYLPGKVQQVSQALGTSTQSQCTWTLDARPDFRVLTVTSQAYTPSLLASGDGSATFNAIDAYNQELQALQDPPKKTKAPKAQIGGAVGLGSDSFTAFQAFQAGGNTTDEVTAVARDRNVLIIVAMQGQEHGGGFGPVPAATLRAAALAVAHEVLAGLR
jgi:hypothetical protein